MRHVSGMSSPHWIHRDLREFPSISRGEIGNSYLAQAETVSTSFEAMIYLNIEQLQHLKRVGNELPHLIHRYLGELPTISNRPIHQQLI